MSDDIVLGEVEQTALKWAMGMPWFERLADPATREAAFSDLCVRLEAVGLDEETDELRERVQGLRLYADEVVAERDRLRAALRLLGEHADVEVRQVAVDALTWRAALDVSEEGT